MTKGRSKDVEVERSKYRKGEIYENGGSTEKVKLKREALNCINILVFPTQGLYILTAKFLCNRYLRSE